MAAMAAPKKQRGTNARLRVGWLIKPFILTLDRLLRTYYGVHEYTHELGCVFGYR
jgi:hypothetical protein